MKERALGRQLKLVHRHMAAESSISVSVKLKEDSETYTWFETI